VSYPAREGVEIAIPLLDRRRAVGDPLLVLHDSARAPQAEQQQEDEPRDARSPLDGFGTLLERTHMLDRLTSSAQIELAQLHELAVEVHVVFLSLDQPSPRGEVLVLPRESEHVRDATLDTCLQGLDFVPQRALVRPPHQRFVASAGLAER
jgi:hypothetical protein